VSASSRSGTFDAAWHDFVAESAKRTGADEGCDDLAPAGDKAEPVSLDADR